VFLDDNRRNDKDGVHAPKRVQDCIPLFRELNFFLKGRGESAPLEC